MALFYFSNTPHATRSDGSKVDTKAHYNYICRKEQYAARDKGGEELVYSRSGNIPAWADGAGDFWQEAEQRRQKGGRAYREIRLGLQEELTLEDNIALIEEFLEKSGIGEHHAFTYAVHDKEAAYDEAHRNIHCHLMFNEKIQEPDRPLDRKMFFKHYYIDKEGKPCAGYRASRAFQSKGAMKELRTLWADIVNRKFAEKGIDKRISEKSLADQAKDLRRAGKHEEAALYDRVPSPHLGGRFKTREMLQKIRDRVKEIARQLEHPEETKEEAGKTDTQDTIEEQHITMFATDKLLRQVTAEIRRERQRLRREEVQAAEARRLRYADDRAAEDLADRPIVITVDDVIYALTKKAEQAAAEATREKEESGLLYGQIIPDGRVRSEAIRRVLGSEYHTARERLKRAEKALRPLEKAYRSRLDEPLAEKKELVDRYLAAKDEQQAARHMLNRLEAYLIGEGQQAFKEALQEIAAENETKRQAAKASFGLYKKAQRLTDYLMRRVETARTEGPPGDTILYEKGLPNLVFRRCRLDGYLPLEELPLTAVDGKGYVLLPTEPGRDEDTSRRALLLGDAVYHGKASVYRLEEGPDGTRSVEKTRETVRLYPRADTAKEQLREASRRYTRAGLEKAGRAASVQCRIGERALAGILQKAVADTGKSDGRYHAWWDDRDGQPLDEVQRLDAALAHGMGM